MRARCLLLALLLTACGSEAPLEPDEPFDPLAPSEVDLAIQERLTGHVLVLMQSDADVRWFLRDDGYRFEQRTDGELVVWNQGRWWIRGDQLVIDRITGARIQAGEITTVVPAHRGWIRFELLGESLYDEDLQVRMTTSSGVFTYRLVRM